MKKIMSFTVAFGLMASLGTAAFADSASTTTSTTTTPVVTTTTTKTVVAPVLDEPLIKANNSVDSPNLPVILTKVTQFYYEPNGKVAGAVAPQVIATTGNRVTDVIGEWVEVYTWLGKSWIHVL
ncbi:hypothetical protein [Paenibacillus pini]|uniref:SH3b domain-containing protein n=1 Tax=Paenibacillus pini JCM 16418 TaxID=1236976 RepID=W7Z0J9_9BACL|nr:hypothetical protein [Paenibacillus pini]GAF10491.1 hypothetical protein JCM16418_4700 [Paenibacillus pini JCM 16418]